MAARSLWLAVGAASLATFSVVTTEMLPVGLLTPIADTMRVSTGSAGLTISLPALLAALFAPLVVIASGGMDRRKILSGLLGLLVIANVGSALAPGLGWLLAARVLVGFCMGGHMGHRRQPGCAACAARRCRLGDIHHLWRRRRRIGDGRAARLADWRTRRVALGLRKHGRLQRAGAGVSSCCHAGVARGQFGLRAPVRRATGQSRIAGGAAADVVTGDRALHGLHLRASAVAVGVGVRRAMDWRVAVCLWTRGHRRQLPRWHCRGAAHRADLDGNCAAGCC